MDYNIITKLGETPHAAVSVKYKKRTLTADSSGDGGYDAFVRALRKALKQVETSFPRLLDYEVRIPPGGKTDALVETTITWENLSGINLVTVGVDSDQMVAAIKATEKMLNLVLTEKK